MNSIKSEEYKPYVKHNQEFYPDIDFLVDDEIVLAFDEWDKKLIIVQYRFDSDIFFEWTYTGALYPLDRVHKWFKRSEPKYW